MTHRFRKTFLSILFFVFFTLFIPTVFTLIFGKHTDRTAKVYSSSSSGRFVVIEEDGYTEELDVEDFIPCAVMGQLSIDNEEELLKTFAVIMRTYIYGKMGDDVSINASDLDIPFCTYSEMESLWGDDFPDYYNRLMKIVSNTSLEVITCDGVLIAPYYHSVSSGYTRLGTEVLGDDFSYLCQANCPDDKASSVFFKAYYYDYDEFASIVRTLDNAIVIDDNEPLKNVQIVSRDSSGYVLDMTIGNITVSGTAFYEAMNINSPSFMIEDYNGCVRITTYGVGHGLGVSLCYASELAKNGASYIEILNYFYTNIVISAL